MRLLISPKRHKEAERQTARTSESYLTRLEAGSPYSEIEMASLKDMSEDIILDLDYFNEFYRREAIKDAFELYKVTKETVAPVIVGFADELLRESDGKKIMFAARDGIGAYVAAQKLLERFPESYEGVSAGDMLYPYLTRSVVFDTNPADLVGYLQQCGVEDVDSPVIMADIGMYGSTVGRLKQVLPNLETRYLISRSHSIPGYADDGSGQMSSMDSIVGNPAVHFMEDTFSGLTSSAKRLLKGRDGTLVPDIKQDAYPAEELLKRKYALRAFEDAVTELSAAPQQAQKEVWVKKLDDFLVENSNYASMMVPHERG